MRIGIDVDGVLADFNTAYIATVIEMTGRDLFPPRPFDIITWNYPESYGYTTEEIKAVWGAIKEDREFWAKLTGYADITEDFQTWVQSLQEEGLHDVYFITQRVGVTAKVQTEAWLAAWLNMDDMGWEFPTVLVSGEKGYVAKALGLTHYIDDKTENLQDVVDKSPTTKTFRMVRPWNVPVEGTTAVTTLQEFQAALQ